MVPFCHSLLDSDDLEFLSEVCDGGGWVTTGVTAVGGAVLMVAEGAADLSKVR
jgi:hypothetical protein